MDSYTITITPNDDSGNQTTLTVDTSTGQARITNVHLHAPDGLTGAQMPSVDVGLLLQAVTRPTHSPTAITATPTAAPPTTPEPAPAHAGTGPVGADVPPATVTTTATPPPANNDTTPPAPPAAPTPAVKRANPRRPAATRTAQAHAAESQTTTPSGTRRSRNQPASKKAAPKKVAHKQATAVTTAGADRVYRKTPDDFAAVYRQASTAAAIADHYGVPRHTAHGWINRLKKQDAATGN